MEQPGSISAIGYRSGMAAAAAAVTYDIVQLLQVAGWLRFPLDEILIYGSAVCIVIPFCLEMLAFHHLVAPGRRFWTHAALLFTFLYAVFVTANYVVQLTTVIPARLQGNVAAVRMLEQTPHSLFWDFDAIGYISMGLATLFGLPALARTGIARWVRIAFLANVLTTPLICVVYFHPTYSTRLLWIGFPWAITAPLSMVLLAQLLRHQPDAGF